MNRRKTDSSTLKSEDEYPVDGESGFLMHGLQVETAWKECAQEKKGPSWYGYSPIDCEILHG